MKNIALLLGALILCTGLTACENSKNDNPKVSESISETTIPETTTAITSENIAETTQPEEKYSDTMLPEEKNSIKVGKLSDTHEFYNEVITLDPECAEYINEISIYDKEIDDTFNIHVSLPPDYDETQKYPMVIMTDGVWRLSDHPELRPLMKDGTIEDIILVSIGYPDGYDYDSIRGRDLIHDPESYLHFIVDNLVPYLEETYPADSENMTLTGHSYGGYWAYYALFNSDTIGKNTFSNYYIGSPSVEESTLGDNLYDFENDYYSRNKSLNANVYVSVGGDEEDWFISDIETFNSQVISHDYEGLNFKYEIIDGYSHDTVFKPSIKNTLIMFYGNEN